MGTYLLLSGFVGILSFIALDHVRTLRRKQAETDYPASTVRLLERTFSRAHTANNDDDGEIDRNNAKIDRADQWTLKLSADINARTKRG